MPSELHYSLESTAEREAAAVPLSLLTRTLDAIQQAVFDAGESFVGEQAPRRAGRRPTAVVATCELAVTQMTSGTISATLKVAEPAAQLLAEEEPPLGDQAVELVLKVLAALESADPARELRRVVTNASYRQRILSDLEAAAPKAGEQYRLTLSEAHDGGRSFVLTGETRDRVARVRYQPEEDVRSVIGDMVQVRVFEPRCFHIRRHERELRCTYAADMQDAVLRGIGETVAVRGRVVLDERDQIRSMDEVFGIEIVDVSPRRVEQVTYEGRTLRLSRPVVVRPMVIEDAVTLELPELGILSYGENSEEALESFTDDLFWVWDEYAQARDGELAPDALALKEHARELLREVEGA